MATILVLGAGMNGLTTAMLLARDGHDVTVLERDPAPPPPAVDAWEPLGAAGRGPVPAAALHAVALAAGAAGVALPDVLDDLRGRRRAAHELDHHAAGTAPWPRSAPDDDRFETVTARRPVLEAVLAATASAPPDWWSGVDSRSPAWWTASLRSAACRTSRAWPRRTADGSWPIWSSTAAAAGRAWPSGSPRSAPGRRSRSARTPASSTTGDTSVPTTAPGPPPWPPPAARRAVHPRHAARGQRHLVRGAHHQLRRPSAAGPARPGGLGGGAGPASARGALGVAGARRPADHRRRRDGRPRGPAPAAGRRRRTGRHRTGAGG